MSTSAFYCPVNGSFPLQCQIPHVQYRYSEASAGWTLICAMIIFFMRAGFMMIELSFSSEVPERRNIVLIKYLDVAASAVGFWLFGFEISNINGLNQTATPFLNTVVVIEDRIDCNNAVPYIVWFFKFGFASNTATLMGGLLIKCNYKLRVFSAFLNAVLIAGIIHPFVARIVWGADLQDFLSPYRFCGRSNIREDYWGRIYLLDFAGGGAVHLVGGMASLALTLIASTLLWWDERSDPKKKEKEEDPNNTSTTFKQRLINVKGFILYMYPKNGGDDNIEQAASGVFILWFGWFAFNCGTTESLEGPFRDFPVYSNVAGRIAVNMITCAAGGGLTATLIASTIQTVTGGKAIGCNEIANGILTSLVAITSNCPYVDSLTAFFIGVIAVVLYHIGVYVEYLTNIFDTGRVVPVHAVGGMWSLLAGGLFIVHEVEYQYIRETYEGVCFCELTLPTLTFGERLSAQIVGIIFISVFTLVLAFVFYMSLFLMRFDLLLKIGNNRIGTKICEVMQLGKGGILFITQRDTQEFVAEFPQYDQGGEDRNSPADMAMQPHPATLTIKESL